ncbi:MAG: hypothetical protein IKN65_02645 [Clostridia bacterium]|nr:hypothetical protein [Clostridia bacterium]
MMKSTFKEESKVERAKTICIILLSITLFVFLTIGINNMMHGGKMGFFSLRFYIMPVNSTETNSSVGDLVVSRKIKTAKIKENDDIIYKKNNTIAMKKVIKVDKDNEDINIHIENDHNLANEKIENAEIMGKVLFTVKGIGNVAMFIQSPLGTLNLLLIALCIFIIIKKIINGNKEVEIENNENDEGKK